MKRTLATCVLVIGFSMLVAASTAHPFQRNALNFFGIGLLQSPMEENHTPLQLRAEVPPDTIPEKYEEELDSIDVDITFTEFANHVNALKITGLKIDTIFDDVTEYVSICTVHDSACYIGVMNSDYFEDELFDEEEMMDEEIRVEIIKEYTFEGKRAKYLLVTDPELVLYFLMIHIPDLRMTLAVAAVPSVPLSSLEEIARQLRF